MSLWQRIDRSDLWVGGAAILGGSAVIPYALTMPYLGDSLGPGLFPVMIAGLAIFLGVALVSKASWKARSAAPAAQTGAETAASPGAQAPTELRVTVGTDAENDNEGAVDQPVMRASLATSERSRWVNAATVLGSIVFYILTVQALGFFITMFTILAGMMLVLRSRWWVALVTAAAVTLVLHTVFQRLLLVQLPSGLLGW